VDGVDVGRKGCIMVSMIFSVRLIGSREICQRKHSLTGCYLKGMKIGSDKPKLISKVVIASEATPEMVE